MTATSDVLIIGGGVIGLAIAVELRLRGNCPLRDTLPLPRQQLGWLPSRGHPS